MCEQRIKVKSVIFCPVPIPFKPVRSCAMSYSHQSFTSRSVLYFLSSSIHSCWAQSILFPSVFCNFYYSTFHSLRAYSYVVISVSIKIVWKCTGWPIKIRPHYSNCTGSHDRNVSNLKISFITYYIGLSFEVHNSFLV